MKYFLSAIVLAALLGCSDRNDDTPAVDTASTDVAATDADGTAGTADGATMPPGQTAPDSPAAPTSDPNYPPPADTTTGDDAGSPRAIGSTGTTDATGTESVDQPPPPDTARPTK
jgi:hypothetical protein